MKQYFINFFVTLGVIFLILIVIGIYFFVTDPYELKPLIFGTTGTGKELSSETDTRSDETENTSTDSGTTDSAVSADGGFALSAAQQQALIGLGIEPSSVPTSVSAEQEVCFTEALGEERVIEIKAGDVPNAMEFLKAQSCI